LFIKDRKFVRFIDQLKCCEIFFMKYKFKCKKCDIVKELEMSVAEYSKFEADCKDCGEKMRRIYESPEFKGCGKDKNSEDSRSIEGIDGLGSACSGTCATCAGCS
jgi:predicted nucleic acid-binding Zn ribbon protein